MHRNQAPCRGLFACPLTSCQMNSEARPHPGFSVDARPTYRSRTGYRGSRCFMLDNIIQPIAVCARRLRLPGVGQLPGYMFRRKFGQQLFAPVDKGARAERVEYICGLLLKIAFRNLWITVPFASQKSSDIPAIFTRQCVGVIFWVALEK